MNDLEEAKAEPVPNQVSCASCNLRAMRFIRAVVMILAFMLPNLAAAHLTAVNLDMLEQSGKLALFAASVDGYAINGARMEFVMMNQSGETFRGPLKETADGEYTAPLPQAEPGAYTMIVRDSTFPGEALEARAELTWPLTQPIKLILPPSTAGAPSLGTLFLFLAIPIVIAGSVLAWVLIRRPKPDNLDPPATV